MRATIKLKFLSPPPPDGLPNFRPHGSFIYQVFNENDLKLCGGSTGPNRDNALAVAVKFALNKGFTEYKLAKETD